MYAYLTSVSRHKLRFLLASGLSILFLCSVMPKVSFAQVVPPPDNANPRSASTLEDTLVSIDTGIPADPRYQVVVIVPGPAHGTTQQNPAIVPINPSGNFKINYTPGANKAAPVSFSYQICTTIGTPTQCGQSALVTVSITPVNDGPQAGPDYATVKYGQSVLINVLANDNGGINEIDSVSLVAGGVGTPIPTAYGAGTAVIEGGQIRYTAPTAPTPTCSSSDVTFTYLVKDSSGLQGSGTVTVTRTCPGTPTLKLSEPYAFNNHTFKIDVILESTDVDVAAVDFFLNYDTCVTDVDVPSNNMIADDVTNMPAAPNFVSQVQDQPYLTPAPLAGALHFVSASVVPNVILAGSTNPSRTIATIMLKALSVCQTAFNFNTPAGFTGTGGTAITGVEVNKTVDLTPTNINNKPTNITLTNSKVPESSPFNTFIGKFAATDPDASDTAFSYSLLSNSSNKFWIRPLSFNNDELAVLNLASVVPGVYPIIVQVTDSYGGIFTKTFDINVTDVNLGAPTAVSDGPFLIQGRTPIPFTSLLALDSDTSDGDPNCAKCSIQSVTNGTKGTVTMQGSNVIYIPTDPKFIGLDNFGYTITDNDPSGALTASANVSVNVQPDAILGDCNKGGTVEAGDLTATGLEIFDGDGNLWYNIYQGTYTNFSSYGCNSNQDNILDAGDIACTAAKIFNPAATCAPVTSASSSVATLAVSGNLAVAPGSTADVAITLNAAGNSVAAAAFAVNFDSSALTFDATDADADGIPDAVKFNVPSGLMTSATYNAEESRVEIIITGLIPPFPLLSDGAIATVSLTTNNGADGSATAVTITNGSLGSDEGASIPVEVNDGTIEVNGQVLQNSLYLPFISAQ